MGNETVRKISIEKNILPRTHGSSLFTRGETQALVVITLGDSRDAQIIDGIMEETKDNLIVHYNFLPYCVGEIGLIGHTKRREIGHGNLVKKGIKSLIPSKKDFPLCYKNSIRNNRIEWIKLDGKCLWS